MESFSLPDAGNTSAHVTTINTTLNDTDDDYYFDDDLFSGYMLSQQISAWVLCPIGIIGNLFTIIALTREKNRRSSTAIFITALAFSDNGVLITGSFFFWLKSTVDLSAYIEVECKLIMFSNISCFYTSSWLLSIISIERAACVLFPHKARDFFTPTTALLTVICVVLCCFLLNLAIPILYEPFLTCGPKESSRYYLDIIFPWIDFMFSFMLPSVIILSCSLILVSYLMKGTISASGKKRDNTSIMVTLLLVNLVFFTTMSPFCIFQILNPMLTDNKNFGVLHFVYYTLLQISELNPVLNFYVYILSSERFRAEIRSLLMCSKSAEGSSGVFSRRR